MISTWPRIAWKMAEVELRECLMKTAILCLATVLLGSTLAAGREPKEYDSDVIYDESKIPHYDLPPLLVSFEGKRITTAEEWFNIRRPQIMSLFGNLVYGVVPVPESPIRTTFEVVKTNRDFMDGQATCRDVQIRFHNEKGQAEMLVLVFVTQSCDQDGARLLDSKKALVRRAEERGIGRPRQ